jgi:hypothetical protein
MWLHNFACSLEYNQKPLGKWRALANRDLGLPLGIPLRRPLETVTLARCLYEENCN